MTITLTPPQERERRALVSFGDEISLGLAPIVVRDIYARLPAIVAEGLSLIIVEQDIAQATSLLRTIQLALVALAIIGAGAVGMEFADIFNAFGSTVSVDVNGRPYIDVAGIAYNRFGQDVDAFRLTAAYPWQPFAWMKQSLIATGEYQSDMDVLGAFIEECCEKDEYAECAATDIWNAYDKWATGNAERKLTHPAVLAITSSHSQRPFAPQPRS